MRLSDAEAAIAIRARLEPLGRTGLSIVYTEKDNSESVLKAAGFWLDGEMYDHAAFAEDTSDRFKREAALYEALGTHPCILGCLGVELLPDGEEAWALRLERAEHGNLREYIENHQENPPAMAHRVRLAIDLAKTLQYVHDRGVIWGDVSARNVLVFDDLHIKLSDFAGSILKDVYPELLFQYEPRYWMPSTSDEEDQSHSELAVELFALGTAICEITEWAVPYGEVEIEVLQQKLLDGDYPHVSENNPVQGIIQRLWHLEYNSAQEVVDALEIISI